MTMCSLPMSSEVSLASKSDPRGESYLTIFGIPVRSDLLRTSARLILFIQMFLIFFFSPVLVSSNDSAILIYRTVVATIHGIRVGILLSSIFELSGSTRRLLNSFQSAVCFCRCLWVSITTGIANTYNHQFKKHPNLIIKVVKVFLCDM